MGWFDDFLKRLGRRKPKPTPPEQRPEQPDRPPKPPFPTQLKPGQQPFSTGYTPVGPDFHTDAALNPDEEYQFLYLERKIDVRSSWITAAQFNSTRQELTIWTENGRADGYTIPDVDERMAQRFMYSTSKGMWWWSNRHRWHGG